MAYREGGPSGSRWQGGTGVRSHVSSAEWSRSNKGGFYDWNKESLRYDICSKQRQYKAGCRDVGREIDRSTNTNLCPFPAECMEKIFATGIWCLLQELPVLGLSSLFQDPWLHPPPPSPTLQLWALVFPAMWAASILLHHCLEWLSRMLCLGFFLPWAFPISHSGMDLPPSQALALTAGLGVGTIHGSIRAVSGLMCPISSGNRRQMVG